MKKLFWALLNLNIAGAVLLFIPFLIAASATKSGMPAGEFVVLFLGGCAYLLYRNIRTIYNARKDIAAFFADGAVDIAASAIEARDAARARVNDRLKERQAKDPQD